MFRLLLFLYLSGVVLGSSACLASCAPVLLPYIAASQRSGREGLISWLYFSLGRIIVYSLLGMLAGILGGFLVPRLNLIPLPAYLRLFAKVFIAFLGILLLIGKFPRNRLCGTRCLAPGLLGAVLALLPCAPLLGILAYVAAVSRNWITGFVNMLVFGLGTVFSPLLLLSVLAAIFPRKILLTPESERNFRRICGIILVIVALIIFI